jgi:uncharacterized protein
MSRPPAAADHLLDAVHASRGRMTIERRFALEDLPRLLEVGAGERSHLNASFRFTQVNDEPAVDGDLVGEVWLKCQRCLQPVAVPIDESFGVVITTDEKALVDESAAYEPIVVDATRLDLRWLAEEQVLLALPLVPMHEPGVCAEVTDIDEVPAERPSTQKPFGNLRDLLNKR